MARLTIEQVKAPDFSASSEMLARANQSFNTGIDSAKGILDKYNTGQQAKGDQALIGALAGLKSEDELANFLQTTDLTQMNISDTMRQNILGAREVILGNNATRQSTVNAVDSNSRANAVEGREAAEYADGVAARDELRGLTPAYIAALAEGQTYGRGQNTNQDWLTYDNQGATRNDPLSPELVQSMSFLGDMGVTMRVTSGGQENNTTEGTGSTRHNHGNAADADFYIGDHKLDWNNPQDLPIFQQIVTQARANGVTGIGAGDDYMGAGRMHVGFGNPGIWGADGKGANAPDWLTTAYNGAPAGTAPITRNGTGGQAAPNWLTAMQAVTHMTPVTGAELLNKIYKQQTQGQDLIDAAEAKRQSESIAGATIAGLQDPNNTSQADMQRLGLSIPGISNTARLNAGQLAGDAALAFGNILAPALAPDTELSAALARTRANNVNTSNEDVFALAKSFDSGVNTSPVGTLFKEIGLDTKVTIEEATSYDNALTGYARAAKVSPAEAAAALAVLSRSGVDIKEALQYAPDEKGYGTIVSSIDKEVGPEAKALYEATQGEQSRREADIASTELQLSTAKSRQIKIEAKYGRDSTEAQKGRVEISNLRDSLLKNITPQEREQNLVDYISKTGSGSLLQSIQSDMAKYPKGTPQGEAARADFERAMSNLVGKIEQDYREGKITENEKELLLRDIRG